MKKTFKLLISLFFIFVFNKSISQTVNGINISNLPTEYMQFTLRSSFFSTKYSVILDYGQENEFSNKNKKILDNIGKEIEFNSIIDILNFMNKNTFEFLSKNTIVIENKTYDEYYLKKKK